jgi:hypothetical protein
LIKHRIFNCLIYDVYFEVYYYSFSTVHHNLIEDTCDLIMEQIQKMTKEERKRRYLVRYNAKRRALHAEKKKNKEYLEKLAHVSRKYYHENLEYRERRLMQNYIRYRQSLLDPSHNLIQQ